ncbi:hypothetical protein U1Q18_000093, partial [Sarracenia purpurea var. burkii]
MKVMAASSAIYFVCILGLFQIARAQNQASNGTTTPSEVSALNSIFRQWGISATNQWNISGEPCSGAAIDPNVAIGDDNPFIKCSCNGGTCHITE